MNALNRSIAPPIHPFAEIRLPKPRYYHLNNNIPIYVLDNAQLELIHLIVECKTGFLYETQKHLTQFSYDLLKESSPDYTANKIADMLAFNGVSFRMIEMADRTHLRISVPKGKIIQIMPIICQFITYPQYREAHVEIYRNLKIKDLAYNSCKTDFMATQFMLHAMFGDAYPVGQFSSKETLQAVTIKQMQSWHEQTFCADNISLFLTGNLDEKTEQFIAQLFSRIPHGKSVAPLPEVHLPEAGMPLIYKEMPDCVQSSILLCRPTCGYAHPDSCNLSVLNTVTGGYFGSRLMQNLREKHGYTYGISSDTLFFGNQGIFCISSDVNVKDTRASIDACFLELQRLQQEPVSAAELHLVRNYMLGELLRDVDNTVSYLKTYSFWKHFGFDEQYFQTQVQDIRNITPEKIQSLAKSHFNYNNFTQIIVGKSDNK